MSTNFKYTKFSPQKPTTPITDSFTLPKAREVKAYHSSFPMYHPTRLVTLKDTAAALGLGSIYIKDESTRFHLNAFKALGGSYAIGSYLAQRLGTTLSELPYARLISDEIHSELGEITFITATDGNHGRGVAWTAQQLKQKSVVLMPKGSARERLENIRACGADAFITEWNYDDTVRYASKLAEENGWVLVQDTSWEGYEQIPSWIMQGYMTMACEAYEQLSEKPTHIFLQAGVGSMAGAVAGFFASVYRDERPVIAIVEPENANCFYRTAAANDGLLHVVTGDLQTIMAGLACGEPCGLAWEILKTCTDFFISCPDYPAAQGMRILANPVRGDSMVVSGESGASAFGCVTEIMRDPALKQLKEELGLNESSKVLFFNTEGATDQENYRRIVWDGAHSREN